MLLQNSQHWKNLARNKFSDSMEWTQEEHRPEVVRVKKGETTHTFYTDLTLKLVFGNHTMSVYREKNDLLAPTQIWFVCWGEYCISYFEAQKSASIVLVKWKAMEALKEFAQLLNNSFK